MLTYKKYVRKLVNREPKFRLNTLLRTYNDYLTRCTLAQEESSHFKQTIYSYGAPAQIMIARL
jgi:hypothetical protein